jgi:SAM-dependent methyltransferase/uncharacterized protein YbaR (Trm112 family)
MKAAFVQQLKCPSCGEGFNAKVFREENHEIEEGTLTCVSCGRVAPIIAGIPRILPVYLNRALVARFPDFFNRHGLNIPQQPPATECDRLNQAIFDAFTFNWIVAPSLLSRMSKAKLKSQDDPLHREDRRIFLDNVAPLDASFFQGKLGLDAGCNVGRHLYAAWENGAEMVGLDPTFAIDRARQLMLGRDRIHLIQGSIFEFPFKPVLFDFSMCFGVLHHTPDPVGGFKTIAASIKPGGAFITMLYGLDEMAYWYRLSHMRGLRALTTRIPLRATRLVCEALALAMKYGLVIPLSALVRVPLVGSVAKRFPFIYLRNDPVSSIGRNFFDRLAPPVTTFHSRSEIERWYSNTGFTDVRVSRREMNAWRTYGVRAGLEGAAGILKGNGSER